MILYDFKYMVKEKKGWGFISCWGNFNRWVVGWRGVGLFL
jgi:hypothetical protein